MVFHVSATKKVFNIISIKDLKFVRAVGNKGFGGKRKGLKYGPTKVYLNWQKIGANFVKMACIDQKVEQVGKINKNVVNINETRGLEVRFGSPW